MRGIDRPDTRACAAAALVLALTACSGQSSAKTAADASASAPPAAPAPAAAEATTPDAAGAREASIPRGPAETIQVLFRNLGAARFAAARDMFDDRLEQALSEDQLHEVWSAQTGELGELKSIQPDAGVERSGKLVHAVELTFERGSLISTVALDVPGHEIAGLFFRRGRIQGESPPYADAAAFRAEEVSIGQDPFRLSGTLTLPVGAGPFPGVVLVHGSGPHDRDETVLANKPFKDLAEGLASRGVAVLRYDKRTFAYATRVGTDISVDEEVVIDAAHALAALRARREIEPRSVFVLGHSLGALLAPEIAERSAPVAGVVLLAPPGRAPWDVVLAQMRYLGVPADLLASTEKDAAAVKRGTPGAELLGMPAAYWRDLAGRDGVGKSRRLGAPLLILRGERDYQVTEDDLAVWRQALAQRPNVVIETLPEDNHLFVPGSGKPGPAEYAKPGHVDPALIERVVAFVERSAPAKQGARSKAKPPAKADPAPSGAAGSPPGSPAR